jgi:hypothetical protein
VAERRGPDGKGTTLRAGTRTGIAAACAIAGLALPAAASAKVVTYGGKVTPSDGGRIAMDVKTSKKGVPKKVIALRGEKIPVQCEKSGPLTITININRQTARNPDGSPFALKVRKNGKFGLTYTDPTYGFKRVIKAQFRGKRAKRVTGTFLYGAHYPADDKYPEETCQTDLLDFGAKRGGDDVVFPVQRQLRR